MRWLVLSSVMVVVPAPPAEACSCYEPSKLVSPRAGSTDIPLNAKLFVRLDGLPPHHVELRGGGQTAVIEHTPLVQHSFDTIVLGTPPADLAPSTMYEVLIDGFAVGSFVTGTARDDAPPTAPDLQAVTPEVMALPKGCGTASCNVRSAAGDMSRFRFAYEPVTDDAALALAEVYPQGAATGDHIILGTLVTREVCGARFAHLDPAATYCARAIVYDGAGNRAEGAEVCSAPPTRCEPEMQSLCLPADTCEPVTGGGCSTSGGDAGWLCVLAISLGWSTRSGRRRRTRAQRPAP